MWKRSAARRNCTKQDPDIFLSLSEPSLFAHLFRPRVDDSNKGLYGHALVIAGSRGKSGAAAMAGIAALRAGAGLVTVASTEAALPGIVAHAPEIMTELLADGCNRDARALRLLDTRRKRGRDWPWPRAGSRDRPIGSIDRGTDSDTHDRGRGRIECSGGRPTRYSLVRGSLHRIPGEMSRLNGRSIAEIQSDRIGTARDFRGGARRAIWY